MTTNDKAIVLNKIIAIVLLIFGISNMFLWGTGIIAFIDMKDMASLVLCLVFFLIFGWMTYCGLKRNKMVSNIKKYKNVIGNVGSMKLEQISTMTEEPVANIEKNFEWMIKKNFFTDAYLDHEQKSIVFKNALMREQEAIRQEELRKQQIEYVSVVCECCGGTTKIEKGKTGICEYCGASIQHT